MMTITVLPEITVLYMLIFARVGSMFMLLPGLGEQNVPVRLRLTVALIVTAMLVPVGRTLYPSGLLDDLPRLLTFFVGEIATGLFVGLTARLVLAASQVAGATVANQMGLGFATTVDPTQGQQGAVIGNFLTLLAVTLIFVSDLHHLAIRGVVDSLTLFRPGQWLVPGEVAEAGTRFVADAFRVGVQIAAPFLVFGLVFYFGLGLLARLMPQFQVFFIAMPLNILLGFVLLLAVLTTMMVWYLDHVRDALGRLVAG